MGVGYVVTEEQKAQVETLLPTVKTWVSRWYRDDEYLSLAYLVLCESVIGFKPEWGISLKTHVYRELRLKCYRERAKAYRLAPVSDISTGKLNPEDDSQPDEARVIAEYLPDWLQRVASLRWLEKMPVADIARVEGLSRRKVEMMIHKAKRYLKGIV